jgi:hypothetical protein
MQKWWHIIADFQNEFMHVNLLVLFSFLYIFLKKLIKVCCWEELVFVPTRVRVYNVSMCLCLFICLCLCLSAFSVSLWTALFCLSVPCPSVCVRMCLSMCRFVHLTVHLSVCTVNLGVCQSDCLHCSFGGMNICLPFCLSVHPPLYFIDLLYKWQVCGFGFEIWRQTESGSYI